MGSEAVPPPAAPEDPHLAYAESERAWYSEHAPRARHGYQALEVVIVVLGAAVPVADALGDTVGVTAILGAGVVIATSLRQVFRWQENWIGFIDAKIELDNEIALYRLGDAPYHLDDRGERLDRAVLAIKRKETDQWRARRTSAHDPTSHKAS